MKNNLIAFFLSLLIHFIILLLIFIKLPQDDSYKPPKHGSKEGERISIKDFKFSQATQNLPQNPPTPTQPQESVPLTTKEESKNTKNDKPTPKTKESKPKTTKDSKTKQPTPKPTPQKEAQKANKSTPNPLASSLKNKPTSKPSSPSIYNYSNNMENQEIKELYGEDLYSLNYEERKFIEDNLSSIGKITQQYLKYPQIAGRMGQQGDNIVEFYLHPNGDISDLKLLTPSGFRLLDDNSLHTIEIAYKDYPYPAVKTKIRIRVMYRIY